MKTKDAHHTSENKLFPGVIFLLVLVAIAWFSDSNQRSEEICRVDGTGIIPITRVELVDDKGEEALFCSLCCARTWLDSHEQLREQLSDGSAILTVVDEISGKEIDASLAYWVQSKEYSRKENNCRVHVFGDKQAASKYLGRHDGKELPGYLADMGQHLSRAADFSLKDIHGTVHSLSDYRGKIVFLRFWSLKNPFVETDLSNQQKIQERFQEQEFTVVAVNVEDSKEQVTAVMKKLAISFPVLLDDGKVADTYQIAGFPTGYLLDKSGFVDSSSVGELTADILEPFLYSLR